MGILLRRAWRAWRTECWCCWRWLLPRSEPWLRTQARSSPAWIKRRSVDRFVVGERAKPKRTAWKLAHGEPLPTYIQKRGSVLALPSTTAETLWFFRERANMVVEAKEVALHGVPSTRSAAAGGTSSAARWAPRVSPGRDGVIPIFFGKGSGGRVG